MGADILILTIYLICVVYILYQMALSVEAKLEDQVEIVLDGDTLQAAVAAQLQQQSPYNAEAKVIGDDKGVSSLQMAFSSQGESIGSVAVQVSPQGKQPLQPPLNQLVVGVTNGFADHQVFVNWDSSSLSVHGGTAQRVVRMVPGSPIDLFQRQVMTVANPGQSVSATITSESLFERPEDKTALKSTPKLLDYEAVLGMKEPLRVYSLRMLVLMRSMSYPDSPVLQLLLPFNFTVRVLPDHVALPVLSWLLDFFSPKKKQKAG